MSQKLLIQFTQAKSALSWPINVQFGEMSPEPTLRIQFDRLSQKQPWPLHVKFGDGKPAPVVPIKRPNIGMEWQLATGGPVLCSQHIEVSSLSQSMHTEITLNQIRLALQRQAVRVSMERDPMQRQSHVISTTRLGKLSHRYAIGWQNAPLQSASVNIEWQSGSVQQSDWCVRYNKGQLQTDDMYLAWRGAIHLSELFKLSYALDEAMQAENHWRYGPKPAGPICSTAYQPQKGNVALRFSGINQPQVAPLVIRFSPEPEYCYWDEGGGLIDAHPTLPDIDFKLPIGPQIRTSYLMRPSFDCVRVSDGLRIMLESASISRSRGNYAAQVNLGFQSRIDAQRARNEVLKVSINGYDFYCLAEQFSDSWQFNSASHSASGRSLLAQLSRPYVLPSSYTNGVSRSFAGVLGEILQNTPWQAEIAFTDFVLPAGAVSLTDKTPAEMVNALAAELGCMCICDDAQKRLTVMPKWPTVPWLIGSAVQDITLHDGVVYSLSSQEQISPACNSVFVRGEQNGVSRQIKRTGTAGNTHAADIANPLIVDDMAARLCGTMALAETGSKVAWSLTCPVMQDLPPLIPGQLVAVTVDSNTFKGVCDSMSISASIDNDGGVNVEQSISLIEPME